MDHHHRFAHPIQSSSRSRCRDRSYRSSPGGGDLYLTSNRPNGQGTGLFRRQASGSNNSLDSTSGSDSPVEENSFTLERLQCSSKKASGTSIKALLDEEMGEIEIRRQSPSVIARLMGLDTLPPPQSCHKQHKEMITSFQKIPSVGFQVSSESDDGHSRRMSTNETSAFKDVYEVVESSNAKKQKNHTSWNGMSCSKQNAKEVGFNRKFMDAKHLPTDELLQNSKKLNDTLEILDDDQDIFLKGLQEPNSLLKKHLHELQCCPPSPQLSQVVILKSSKGTMYNDLWSELESREERYAHERRDVISSFRKSTTSRLSHSSRGHTTYHPHKLPKSQHTDKNYTCHSTRIIVLKPSLEKACDAAREISLRGSSENIHVGFSRRRGFHLSRPQELHEEGRQRHNLLDNGEVAKHKAKGSREIAREITKQMRQSFDSSTQKVSTRGFSQNIKFESSCMVSGLSSSNNFEGHQQTPDNFVGWKNNFYSSSSYSNRSSVGREARKRLSERWKMTHGFKVGRASRGSNTLGEMLALTDSGTPRMTLDSFIGQKVSDEKFARDEILRKLGHPSGISSRDGWKDGCSINLPRSVSLPPAPTDYGTPKASSRHSGDVRDNCYMLKDVLNLRPSDFSPGNFTQRSSRRSYQSRSSKSRSFNYGGEENKHHVAEIYMKQEETKSLMHVGTLAEKEPMHSEAPKRSISKIGLLVENSVLPMDANFSSLTKKEQAKDGELSSNKHNDIIPEETSRYHFQVDSAPSHCKGTEPDSPMSSKESDQPSPASVLEPPFEEEESSFERVGADLQELRMQLQLLKLETEPEVLSSGEESISVSETGDREEDFVDKVIACSGIDGVDRDELFEVCYSPEHPVGPGVFERLERRLGEMAGWSRSERKLLFHHANSVLAEILGPCMDLHPWVGPARGVGGPSLEGLAGKVWRTVVRQREELGKGDPEAKVLDLRWLGLEDDVDAAGREVARMVKDDLLEELVLELLS